MGMDLQAIFISNGLGLSLLTILFISRHIVRQNRRLDDRIFTVMVMLAWVACIVEPLSFLIDGRPGALSYWSNLLLNSYLYSATCLTSVLWVLYVDMRLYRDRRRLRGRYRIFFTVGCALMVLLVFNLPLGFFFQVDADNVYHRMPLGYIFYGYLFVSMLVSTAIVRQYRRVNGRALFFPLFMFFTPILVGAVLQILFYGISMGWSSVSLGITGVYLSLQSQQSFVDVLTGLYNRQFLEHQMLTVQEDQRSSYFGIMIDLDRFKKINDTFGHSVGDEALCRAADIFLKCTVGKGSVFRFAGDEFIILLKTAEVRDVIEVESQLREASRSFNEQSGRPYRLGFSIGHARFEPEADTLSSFFRKLDREMYQDKAKNHEQAALHASAERQPVGL